MTDINNKEVDSLAGTFIRDNPNTDRNGHQSSDSPDTVIHQFSFMRNRAEAPVNASLHMDQLFEREYDSLGEGKPCDKGAI